MFTRGLGLPIHPDTPSQLMPRLIARHNLLPDGTVRPDPLPPSRFHDLRHVHATILLSAGVPVHVVAARLGHADPSITLRVYAHVLDREADEVADLFARQMGDGEAGSEGGVSKGVSKTARAEVDEPDLGDAASL